MVYPSEVHTVLVVLPVVGLVGPPWEEVLREDKNSFPVTLQHFYTQVKNPISTFTFVT